MSPLPWIKFYTEILHDPKMGRLTDRLWRRVGEIFLLAQEHNAGGYLPELPDMAWTLRTTCDALFEDLEALAAPGLEIIKRVDGQWFVTNFASRQDADSNAERQKRYRERKQKATYYGNDNVTNEVTEGNESNNEVVLILRGEEDKRREEEEGDVTRNAAAAPSALLVTDRDAESLLLRVTKFSSIPPGEIKRLDQVIGFIQVYGLPKTEQALTTSFQTWVKTPRKNGTGNYSSINFGWVDRAQEVLAGYGIAITKDPMQMTHDEFIAYYQKKAEEETP